MQIRLLVLLATFAAAREAGLSAQTDTAAPASPLTAFLQSS